MEAYESIGFRLYLPHMLSYLRNIRLVIKIMEFEELEIKIDTTKTNPAEIYDLGFENELDLK
jgi:hypothetical protein